MRRRGRNPNENPGVRSVERIELSEKSPKKRLIIVVVLVVFSLVMIGIAVFSALEKPAGWTKIEPARQTASSSSFELVFNYELGASGANATAENRELSALYGELCEKAYKIFDAELTFDEVKNLYYINNHIGEEVTVDPALYAAFELLEGETDRWLYTAPFYDNYRNMFSQSEDALAAQYDPEKNDEVAEYFARLAEFVGNESHVKLELLGEDRVKLTVSQEYAEFAEQNGVDKYIDLYWAKNAFVVDYIADALAEKGYTYGFISSYDGFTRNLDTRELTYSMNLFAREQGKVYGAARCDYQGKNSVAVLSAFKVGESNRLYYVYNDGTTRNAYVDSKDGLNRTSADSLMSCSKEKSCGELVAKLIPIYITEDFNTDALNLLAQNGICSVYFEGTSIVQTRSDVTITPNEFENIKFTVVNAK